MSMKNSNDTSWDGTNDLPIISDVRHPRWVLYNSKELSVLIHTVKQLYYLCYYNEGSNNDMFRPYMWVIFRL